MATSYAYQEGGRIDHTPGSDVAAGEVVTVDALLGVAPTAIPANKKGAIAIDEIMDMPKTTGQAWTVGQSLFWNASTSKVTNVPNGTHKLIGTAAYAAASGDTRGYVMLNGLKAVSNNLGLKVAGGEVTLDGSNPTPVTTGLNTILAAGVIQKSTTTPGDDPSGFTVDYTAGALSIYAWKNTGGTDPTLVASTNSTAVLTWWAIGY